MFAALLPKGAPFFELLIEQNAILQEVAAAMVEIIEYHTNIEKPHREIATLEDRADSLHVTISKHLSQTFITPIDREDILHINKHQEEAIDLFHNLANRLYIFEFERIRFPMLQLAKTVNDMTKLTGSMLEGLSKRVDSHDTKVFRTLRGECEMLLSMGLGELFDQTAADAGDILSIIKWNQAYDRMELVIFQVVKLAETIEEAVLKNV